MDSGRLSGRLVVDKAVWKHQRNGGQPAGHTQPLDRAMSIRHATLGTIPVEVFVTYVSLPASDLRIDAEDPC